MEQDASAPRSVARFIGLFEAIARAPDGLSLAELSAALASPKSSLLTILRPLVTQHYLIHGSGRYQLGPMMFQLAASVMAMRKFPGVLRPYSEDLVARTGETALIVVLDRAAEVATYIDTVDSPQAIRYTVPVGVSRPLYCSAAGLLLLAYAEEAWRDRYMKIAVLKPLTPKTITNRAVLRRRLDEIRLCGIAVSVGEAVLGAAGIAAPVFDSDGSVAAALLIGAPVDRFEQELPTLSDHIREVATMASAAMGYRPRPAQLAPSNPSALIDR